MTAEFLRSVFGAAATAELAMKGEPVTVRRGADPGIEIVAKVSGYQPVELVNGIVQTGRKVVARADDIPLNPMLCRGDKIRIGGRQHNIEGVDASTMSTAGLLIITVLG